MKNIIFIAPPAAGKGTISDILVKKHQYNHISTGDLLREIASQDTELGRKIKSTMESGEYVSDELIIELLKNKLISLDNELVVLDGYPRTLAQAESLNSIFSNYIVIYIDVDYNIAKERSLGRMNCPKCNRGYNKYSELFKPLKEGYCDDCNISLVTRGDDNEESFKNRFNTYVEKTLPIIEYYKELGLLEVIPKSITDSKEAASYVEKLIGVYGNNQE